MKRLNLVNVKEDDILNRNEMKNIMAGSGGNIYCSIGGSQWQCGPMWDLEECTDHCVNLSEAWGVSCWGCAQFP